MKHRYIACLVFGWLLGACASGGGAGTPGGTELPEGGAFGEGKDGGKTETSDALVLERSDVQRFRGTEMVRLLELMDSNDPADWDYVRRHVYPPPARPRDWPPRDIDDMSEPQRKYRSFLLWPEHLRNLLLKDDWDDRANRDRLARYGRMYHLLHEFQTRRPYNSPTRESEYWREFAESMLAYGDDGEELLIANMITAFSSPDKNVVFHARDILVQIGPPAIEPLCAALWTFHRQLVEVTDPRTGELEYQAVGNPDFNEYIVETLYRIGPRAAPQAIYELENSLDADGRSVGSSWRFRRYFINLVGRLGETMSRDTRGDVLKTLEAEIDRVVVEEYDEEELARGRRVVDPVATDDAEFLFHEHIIQAVGNLRDPRGLRAVIKLWEMDDFHADSALRAIFKMTGKRDVRSVAGARELARSIGLEVDD